MHRSHRTTALDRARTSTGTLLVATLALAACGPTSSADPRFATPERTVETMLAAHGAAGLSGAAIQARMASEGALPIVDREAYAACFVDRDEPGGEALAEYVFGMIAAAKDDLRYETIAERGAVIVRPGVRVAMRRGRDGAYRISLRESVPEDVRRRLGDVTGTLR